MLFDAPYREGGGIIRNRGAAEARGSAHGLEARERLAPPLGVIDDGGGIAGREQRPGVVFLVAVKR